MQSTAEHTCAGGQIEAHWERHWDSCLCSRAKSCIVAIVWAVKSGTCQVAANIVGKALPADR